MDKVETIATSFSVRMKLTFQETALL